MVQLTTIKLRALIHSPLWWVLLAAWGGVAYFVGMSTGIGFGSIGEWGRLLLAGASLFAPVFSGLLVVRTIFPILAHQEVLWSCPSSCKTQVLSSLLALLAASTGALIIGVSANFAIFGWIGFTPVGIGYAAAYLLAAIGLLAFWSGLSTMTAYLTRSRTVTLAVPILWWILIMGRAAFRIELPAMITAMVDAAGGSLPHWISPLNPWGLTPLIFGLNYAIPVGLSALVAVGILLSLGRRPAWKEANERVWPLAMVGLAIIVGSAAGTAHLVEQVTGPFTRREMFFQVPDSGRRYLIDRTGTELVSAGGRFASLIIPPDAPLPAWVQERISAGDRILRHDGLVLLMPAERTYPAELKRNVAGQVDPMIARAKLWLPETDVAVISGPAYWRRGEYALLIPEGILIAEPILRLGGADWQWEVAWGLAGLISERINPAAIAYLTLYLVEDERQIAEVIALLERNIAIAELDPRDVHSKERIDVTALYEYIAPNAAATPEQVAVVLEELRRTIAATGRGRADLSAVPLPALRLRYERLRMWKRVTALQRARILSEFAPQQGTVSEGPPAGHQPPPSEENESEIERLHAELDRDLRAQWSTPHSHFFLSSYDAWLILQYWQRGEELGHENFIRSMLEEKTP